MLFLLFNKGDCAAIEDVTLVGVSTILIVEVPLIVDAVTVAGSFIFRVDGTGEESCDIGGFTVLCVPSLSPSTSFKPRKYGMNGSDIIKCSIPWMHPS